MNICVEGEGQALILLHGWGLDHRFMEPVFHYFKNQYRVCMMDLPGFGKSVPLPRPYTIDDYVNTLINVIQTYHLENPIFIAHSFGARIVFRYASLYTCKYMILSGAAGIKTKRNLSYYIKVYTYKICKHLNIHVSLGSQDYRNANEVLRKTLVKVVNEDLREDICYIKCPMLLVWGENDLQTPLWMAHTIKSLNANASLIVFEKDDHFAYYHQMQRFLLVCKHALEGCEIQ